MWMCPNPPPNCCRLQRHLEDGRLHNGMEKTRHEVQLILEDGTPYPLEGTLQVFARSRLIRRTGSVILRMVFPNPKRHSPAGHVRPGGGEGRGALTRPFLIPQQGGLPRSQGESRRADRGRGKARSNNGCSRSIGPSATNGSSPQGLHQAIG